MISPHYLSSSFSPSCFSRHSSLKKKFCLCFLSVEEGRNENIQVRSQTGRRTQLPSPQPDTSHLSLWNILKKNIGKDLSKIAMPVALNEPLSMLQVTQSKMILTFINKHRFRISSVTAGFKFYLQKLVLIFFFSLS